MAGKLFAKYTNFMSRIGKQPIEIPQGVEIKIEDRVVKVKGAKGNLEVNLPPKVKVSQKDNELEVSVPNPNDIRQSSFWGLGRTLVANAILGANEGFEKKLEVNGVGYKAALQGNNLILNVGYSHPVEIKPPEGITLSVDGNVITVFGADKKMVGEIASQIRAVRKPEPYKGKGIKYDTEVIRRKAGKVVKEAAA